MPKTTPTNTRESSSTEANELNENPASETLAGRDPSHEQIAVRAYFYWEARGCPHGSPETDWEEAERELREEKTRPEHRSEAAAAAASA